MIKCRFYAGFEPERKLKKKKSVESKHSLKERDHLIVRIVCGRIGGEGPVCDHETMGFPLVDFELKVLAGCIELLCIVVYAIDRAWLVAGSMDDQCRICQFPYVFDRHGVVCVTPRIGEAIESNPGFQVCYLREEKHRIPSPGAKAGKPDL